MEPKGMDLKNCTVTLEDGASTPNTLDLKIDEGNITWSEKRNITAKKDRGILDYMKEGDQEACEVKLECRFAALTSSSGDPVTPYEFIKGQGSNYVSTSPECSATAINIIVTVDQDCGTSVEDEIIVFSDFTYTQIDGDFKAGTLSVSGLCLEVGPSSTRTTLT